ncbi:MAG: hypothetical protein ACI9R3_003458 [Verrucomicrobiales bacterium]|jgi:hypothetical protein
MTSTTVWETAAIIQISQVWRDFRWRALLATKTIKVIEVVTAYFVKHEEEAGRRMSLATWAPEDATASLPIGESNCEFRLRRALDLRNLTGSGWTFPMLGQVPVWSKLLGCRHLLP